MRNARAGMRWAQLLLLFIAGECCLIGMNLQVGETPQVTERRQQHMTAEINEELLSPDQSANSTMDYRNANL